MGLALQYKPGRPIHGVRDDQILFDRSLRRVHEMKALHIVLSSSVKVNMERSLCSFLLTHYCTLECAHQGAHPNSILHTRSQIALRSIKHYAKRIQEEA